MAASGAVLVGAHLRICDVPTHQAQDVNAFIVPFYRAVAVAPST